LTLTEIEETILKKLVVEIESINEELSKTDGIVRDVSLKYIIQKVMEG